MPRYGTYVGLDPVLWSGFDTLALLRALQAKGSIVLLSLYYSHDLQLIPIIGT